MKKKNNFKKGFKNLTIKLKMALRIILGILIVTFILAFMFLAFRFTIDVTLLVSRTLAAKYAYAGFVAPFAVITGIMGFVYKHVREN